MKCEHQISPYTYDNRCDGTSVRRRLHCLVIGFRCQNDCVVLKLIFVMEKYEMFAMLVTYIIRKLNDRLD